MLWLVPAVISILPQAIQCDPQDRIYSDEYYEDENLYSATAIFQGESADFNDSEIAGDSRFIADLLCSSSFIKLTIDRRRLPRGLGLKENVEESRNEDPFCYKTTRNSSHYTHEVLLSCDSAIDVFHSSDSVTYSHEFSLEDIDRNSERKPYTVVMDCIKSTNPATDTAWDPVYRLMENRRGSQCSKACPYQQLCIQAGDVTGYFCECSSKKTEACECPANQYRCSSPQGQAAQAIVCLHRDKICDTKYDCPLKDDEMCEDVFGDWSNWSLCNCTSGLKSRQRTCKRILATDGARMSRDCDSNRNRLTQTKSCEFRECSRVECNAKSMKIEIPFEIGMTPHSVMRNMRISDVTEAKECLPKVNSTHAIFDVPLHKCSSRTWVEGDIVFYDSTVRYQGKNDKNSIIVREYDHSYTARCQYQRRQTISLKRLDPETSVNDEVAALNFEERSTGRQAETGALDTVQHYSSGDGVFEYKMEIYTDMSYSSRYSKDDYPLKKRLGERLYVGVSFLSQDEDLTVFIERCTAVSTSEMDETESAERYLFIEGGCAVDATVKFHNSNNNSFSDRYSIQTFKFLDSKHPYIYFRCDVIVCDTDEDDPACQRDCVTPRSAESRRRKREISEFSHTRSELVQGPIVVYEEDDVFDLGRHDPVQRHTYVSEERQRQLRQPSQTSSSIILPLIIGILSLSLGVAIGLFLSRRAKRTKPKDQESHQQRKDEAQTVMMEDC